MNKPDPAGIAGTCFVLCALLVGVVTAAYAAQCYLLEYGPVIRGFLLELLTPQFWIGVLAGLSVAIAVVLAAVWESRWESR